MSGEDVLGLVTGLLLGILISMSLPGCATFLDETGVCFPVCGGP